MLLVPTKPTRRELRILRNLIDNNYIWEEIGQKHFVQFDGRTGKQVRIRPDELERMATSGWIRHVRFPRSAQRLDRYELTEEGSTIDLLSQRKTPQRELESIEHLRHRPGA